jgi:hypothetical protein
MGAAGRARVERLFDERQCAAAVQAVYDEILDPRQLTIDD